MLREKIYRNITGRRGKCEPEMDPLAPRTKTSFCTSAQTQTLAATTRGSFERFVTPKTLNCISSVAVFFLRLCVHCL